MEDHVFFPNETEKMGWILSFLGSGFILAEPIIKLFFLFLFRDTINC